MSTKGKIAEIAKMEEGRNPTSLGKCKQISFECMKLEFDAVTDATTECVLVYLSLLCVTRFRACSALEMNKKKKK